MTKAFNLTAQINLRGPANLKPIVADIRRQLGSVSSDINIRLNPQVAKSINTVTDRLKSMNDMLVIAKNNSDLLNKSLFNLSSSLSNVGNSGNKSATAISKTGSSAKEVAQNIKESATTMEEFGKQSYLAVKRFAAFSIATTAIYQLINAISSGFVAFINFDKQLIKLQQVTGKGALGLKSLEKEITNLSVNLGISSESLIEVASTLAQAGLNAEETRIALVALAKTELAPSFDNLTDTTEGAIAALRQFELQAGDLEAALGSINAVSAAFAVESKDIISAIQRTGGVFASASKGVSEGKDALNEFIAVFTSVRQTTRESAETIATGLRTIFTRIQRGKTIEALKEYGIILTDLEGKFVGPYEAVKRLSEGLKLLDPRDLRFSEIVEELGGFRQIGKVIPLIQQFATAQKALKIAQTGQGSLSEDQIVAQKSLANQIAKVREQFLALIRDLGKSTVFQGLFKIVTSLASSLISLAGAFKPILPFLGVLAAVKGASALTQFAGGFFGSMNKGGAKNGGDVSGSATGLTKEKEKSDATNKATEAIKANTAALNQLTSAVQSLSNKIGSAGGPTTLNSGGKVLGFNKGGVVPGSGRGDKVPALLEPGEVVMNNSAVNKYGKGNLVRMNKYVGGGKVNITAQELKGRSRSSKAIENLITDDEDMALYGSGRAINTLDNISFNRRIYKLYDKDSINDWNGFEEAVQKRVGGTRTNIGKNDPSFPIDIIGSNLGPLEVRNRNESTSNRTLLDKLIRYYISKPDFSKLQNRPTPDDIPLGNIGVVYNSAKYDPPNAKELMTGGKIQKFMAGGIAEEYYGQKEVEAAKQAQAEYQQAIAEAFRLENIYFDTEEAKSIKEGTTPEVYGTGIGKLAKGQPGVVGRKSVSFTKAETGQLSDNDYKQIAKRFKDSALATRTAQIKAYTEAEESIATFKTSGLLENIDPNIMEYLSGTINNIKSSTIDPKTIASVTKKLTTPNAAAFSDLMKGKKVEVQGQRTKLAEIFNSILETYGSDVSPMEQSSITSRIADITLKQRQKKEPSKASLGGEIQRFMAGGVAQSINRETLSPEELVSWISELGTPQEIRGLAGGTANIQSKLKSVISTKPATPKQIFDKRFILGDQSTPYLSAIQDLLEIADSNKSRPRVFSSEEKANATRLGLVGMFPLGLNDTRYEDISGRVVSINTATLPKDKLETVLEMRKGIDEVLSRSTQALYGTTGQQLDDTTKEALGLGNLEGYMIEAILAKAGANPGRLDDRSVDYPTGLGAAAGLFGIDPNIPTEIKRDAKGGLSKARANFRNYFSKFAFGGKAEGPDFETVKKQIMDRYQEIDFRISKRKKGRGFGYNLLGALKTDGGLLQSKGLKFEQPTNLKQLQEYADKLATKLINPEEFAVGGLAEATGSMQSLMSEPYGNKQQQEVKKEQKIFGKVALRTRTLFSGDRIQATYIKEGEAATARSGEVIADKINNGLYSVKSSQATRGYGPKLYDIVMEAATAQGAMLTSDRQSVSSNAKGVWDVYFNSRSDVKKTPLDPKNWTTNNRLIDPKLYGKPETWPPATDPAWILQSGYSKAPSDINNTNLVQRFASGGTVPAMVSNGEAFVPPNVAKKIGYAKLDKMNQADRNGMKGFASGGISTFKGAGNGTSDSIGPIGLPTGSYVIREKATKALGFNKGGAVGTIQKFEAGGAATEGLSSNIVSNFEAVADSLGTSMYELAQKVKETASMARDAALAQGKSMKDAAKAAEEATASLLGLNQSISPGEDPLEGKSYGPGSEKDKMAKEAIKASGTVITNVETSRAARQRDLAPEGVTVSAPGDAAAAAASKGFNRKGLISEMAGNTGAGVESIVNTYNEITAKIAEAETKVKQLSDQQIDIKNAGGDSSEVDAKLSSAQTEAESLRASRTSTSAMAGASQGIETDVGLNIVKYIQNFEKLNEVIEEGAKKVANAKTQEEQAKKNQAVAKNKVVQERAKSIEGGSYTDRLALAKKAVEAGDYDKSSESAQGLDRAKINRQNAAKERYSAEKSLESKQKAKTRTYGRSTNIDDSLESSRRLSGNGNPFYEAKKAADAQKEQAKTSPFGLGPEDPGAKTRREQNFADQEFIKYKAAQTGTSETGVKLDLAQKLGKQTYESKKLFGGKVAESKTGLVTRRQEAVKIGSSIDEAKAAIKKAKESGNEDADALRTANQQLADANSRLSQETETILQQMIDLRPDLAATTEGMDKLSKAASEVANDLKSGDLQAAQAKLEAGVAGSEEGGGLSKNEAEAVARSRVAKETGVDAGLLERQFGSGGASAKMAEQQAFIQSREGQRFGKLAEFAPGLAQTISGAGGEGLGKAADFVSGKGGKFSKGFASLGGFQGIGSGLAVGSEMLKTSGLISKQTLKDPNVAGAFGAVQGAGVGAATGAELGGAVAGDTGRLVGAIGGAIIGGIKGFFDAKNAQILTNALDKLSKSSEGVDIAFKELAKNDTDKNFKNVQKAFGQQIEASKELENIAFGGGEGPSAGGVGGGALAGAGIGALSGAMIAGPIGAAIGAALGGLVGGVTAYMSASQSKANKEEALKNRVGSAGAMNESAARMAERQMGRMTNEELETSKQSGTNLIAQQYKESTIAAAEAASKTGVLTAKQKEKIGQDAMETAALDAYMKQRKEAGATDQQITDDILADRKLALESGKKALDIQDAAARKQEELARATKQVAVATESLLDVYRRAGANAQRFSDEIDDMLSGTQANIASLGGNASVQKVDRSGSERVLGNMAAYSSQEVEAATQEMVGKLGGGEEAQALGKQAEAAKFLQDRLPGMLKQEGADPKEIMDTLGQQLGTMGISGGPIETMLNEIEKQLEKDQDSGLGTLADEISSGGIDKFSMTAAEAAKTLQNLSKTYNDTLQKSIDLQNQYNQTVMQSNSYLRKAGTIRINAELDLAKALGNSPTLEQLNQPFDFEVQDLTKGLVPGGTSDPAAIAAGITAKTAENQQLQAANANLGNVGMTGASGDAGAKLLSEQQKNIAAMGANSVAINEGRQALEKLANDGTKAANALGKIEEQQRQVEGLANRFEKIFTSSPEELFKMNRQSDALSLAQTAGAEQFKGRAFRQDAFAGLEQDKEFLRPEEYNKQRGMLIRKSLEAQGKTGQSMIEKGGVSMTVDDFIKRIEGGVSEEDPAVKAYREAVAVQIQANEKLAMLEELKSLQIQEAMLGLQIFLANEFPKILADAVKASKEDAQTKPETKTEASKGEKAKAEAEGAKTTAEKKRKELDTKIEKKQLEVSKAEKAAGGLKWSPGAGAAMDVKIKKRELAELKAQRDSKVKEEEAAATKSKEADTTLSEEKKTKDQAKAAQVAEEKKAKEATVSSSMEQSQRARAGVAPATIPAPPAPGSPAAARDAELAKNRAEQETVRAKQTKEAESNKPQTPLTQQTQTASVMYGATQPQVQTVDKFTEDRLKEEKRKISSGLDSLTLNKAAKAKEIQRKEKTFKAAKIAASAAGTKDTSPTLAAAQESYEMAKADMESIDQQMKEAQDRTNAINQKLTPSTEPQRPASQPSVASQTQAQNRVMNDVQQLNPYANGDPQTSARMDAYSNPTHPFEQRLNAPVPSNLPKPVEYSRQAQAADTGTPTQPTQATEKTAQLLTLDQSSLDGLNSFNTNFGAYVDKLVNFQFPTIPEKIEMTGTHTVDVRVSGAAAFESLQKNIQDLINKEIDVKMAQIWKQTGGQIGQRPGTPPSKGK